MTKNLLLLICILTALTAFAQPKVTVSDELRTRDSEEFFLVGAHKDTLMILYESKNLYVLQKYDENLKTTDSYILGLKASHPDVIGVFRSKMGYEILYTYFEQGVSYVKDCRLNERGLTDTIFTLVETKERLSFDEDKVIVSDDKSKVLFYAEDKDYNYKFWACDLTKKAGLKKFTAELSKDEKNCDFTQALISNDGTAYLIYDFNNVRSKRKSSAIRVDMYKDQTEKTRITIPMENSLWMDSRFEIDNLNGSLVGIGFYSMESTAFANGIFWTQIPLSNPENAKLKFNMLSETTVTNFTGKKPGKHKGRFDNTLLRTLILRKDGGVLLFGEKYKTYTRRYNNGPMGFRYDTQGTQISYYYDDLLNVSLHPDGNIHWQQVLFKSQTSQDDFGVFSSYFLFKTKNALRVLYNDQISLETNLNEYVVTGKGENVRNSLLNTAQIDKIRLRVRDALQTDFNTVFVPAHTRNGLKFVKLYFTGN